VGHDKPPRRRFTFTVGDAGGPDDPPPIHRVRAWLKAGLRGWRLRCVEGRETTPEADHQPQEQTPSP
jgi:hypothetical protein